MARRKISVILAMNRKTEAANLGSKLQEKDKSKYTEYTVPIGNTDGQSPRGLLNLYNENNSE